MKLQPWGTVIGRVVDETGKPRTDVEIFSTTREQLDPERGDLELKPTVNAEGRFRIDGLVPGVEYNRTATRLRRPMGRSSKVCRSHQARSRIWGNQAADVEARPELNRIRRAGDGAPTCKSVTPFGMDR